MITAFCGFITTALKSSYNDDNDKDQYFFEQQIAGLSSKAHNIYSCVFTEVSFCMRKLKIRLSGG